MIEATNVKGIERLHNGRYKATIKAMNDRAYLGCFATYEEAAQARLKAEKAIEKHYPGLKPGMRVANKSGVKGISYHKRDRRWMVHKNKRYLGSSQKLSEAKQILDDYVSGTTTENQNRSITGAMRKMDVGDSILTERTEVRKTDTFRTIASRIGIKIRIRRDDSGEYRIWRTA